MHTESPEVAKSLLEREWYNPQQCSDVWGLGLLMLEVVGGNLPDAQWQLQNSQQYLEEADAGHRMPTRVPAQRKHLITSVSQ